MKGESSSEGRYRVIIPCSEHEEMAQSSRIMTAYKRSDVWSGEEVFASHHPAGDVVIELFHLLPDVCQEGIARSSPDHHDGES